ncbi:MAG: RNA polymerase factor sigma-32 [Proteobacteria bacterium]|nr:RNA polymerase factor sigma-32 [Pseudomonadota bacterium]
MDDPKKEDKTGASKHTQDDDHNRDPIEAGRDPIEAEIVESSTVEPLQAEVAGVPASDADETKSAASSLASRNLGGVRLARYDALQVYMRDVQRYALLEPDEERRLAARYRKTGDVDAAAQLVTANLRLVVKIAYDYRRAYRNLLDLIQEGNIGLMQAVKKYDPYRGVKLSTYAAWWIRAYILRFILNNARLVKLGTTQAQRKLFFNLRKEKAKLSALGIDATPEVVAKRLKVPTEEVVQMDRRLASGDLSLDAPSGREGSSSTRVELLPAESKRIDELLADEEYGTLLKSRIHQFGNTLSGKEARIFDERLLAETPRTLAELGKEFGVSRERVRQLEKRLQGKLRAYLDDELRSAAT